MAITDPISDMLTRIRNAAILSKPEVIIPASRLKLEILRVLKEEGYIDSFEKDDMIINVILKKDQPEKLIRVSKPGRRIYSGKEDIPTVLQGHGLVIISTSKGVMSGKKAKQEGLGGEILCKVW
jgi:small subunit ribosomal protein S8